MATELNTLHGVARVVRPFQLPAESVSKLESHLIVEHEE